MAGRADHWLSLPSDISYYGLSSAGIRSDSTTARRERFGENRVPDRPSKTYLQLCWAALQDITIWMLCAAALVSGILCGAVEKFEHFCYFEPIAIVFTVLLVSNIAAIMDYQKEIQFR